MSSDAAGMAFCTTYSVLPDGVDRTNNGSAPILSTLPITVIV